MTMTSRHAEVTTGEAVNTALTGSVSWGAILAGVVTALGLQLLLNLLGVGLGFASLDPLGGDNPAASTFSIAAGLWWGVSSLIAAYAGGYLAGRLSGSAKAWTSAWHGFVSWAVATLIVVYLLSSAVGGIIGGALGGVSTIVGGASRAAGQALPAATQVANPFASIEQQV